MTKKSLTYRDAGVDIDAGNQLVENIKPAVKKTLRPEVMSNLGGFGALCKIPNHYNNPVLVAGTDGVGTKLKLAIDSGYHDTVGIDLVAMCVNDLIVQGAEPLFFLDYYATSSLDTNVATAVINGIAKGCQLAGCSLIGGETAEMPGMYNPKDYDLAGFCVGIVEENDIIDGTKVKPGNHLIALESNGFHSNGFSLVRKIIEVNNIDVNQDFEGEPLIKRLLEPTRIYVKTILSINKTFSIHAISHITGGGIIENLPRVLPADSIAEIDPQQLKIPSLFRWFQKIGNIDNNEMFRTFNCGVGLVLCVDAKDSAKIVANLAQLGEKATIIGEIKSKPDNETSQVIFKGSE